MEQPLHIVCQVPNGGNNGSNNKNPSGWSTPEPASFKRPEMMLIHIALCLRIIEVTTSGLRQLSFAWATVILLSGFVSNLKPIDFWFVIAILVVEGTRLFTRGIEHQQQRKRTLPLPANTFRRHIQSDSSILSLLGLFLRGDFIYSNCIGPYQMRKLDEGTTLSEPKRTELPTDDPLLAYSGWEIVKNTSGLPYYLQLFLASTSVALSVTRLVQQGYRDDAQINLKYSVNIFYSLALGEALMFFLEMGCWIRIEVQKLFQQVAKEYKFGSTGMGLLYHLFDNAYSKCIEGRIFEVFDMNLFSFAKEFFDSESRNEQIIGLTILRLLVQEITPLTHDTLNKIGNSTPLLKLLIEMLNWRDPKEKYIRLLASEIVSKLASYEKNALLVTSIPGAMESIASLLQFHGEFSDVGSYKASLRDVEDNIFGEGRADGRSYMEFLAEVKAYDVVTFNQLGLLILEHLTRVPDNCLKIMSAPELLSGIVFLTYAHKELLRKLVPESPQIMTMCLALQIIRTLACATKWAGQIRRRDIFENIQILLKYGERHSKLQILGLEILTSLGKNSKSWKNIADIANMLDIILGVFFGAIKEVEGGVGGALYYKAEEVLVMVVNESCKKLVDALGNPTLNPTLRVNAAFKLNVLHPYSIIPCEFRRVIVVEALPIVLKTIMEEKENEIVLESIEVAINILEYHKLQDYENEIKIAGITDEVFAQNLVEILRTYENPEIEFQKIEIVIKLAISLMNQEQKYITLLRDLGLEQCLTQTAWNADAFNVEISNLIEKALSYLNKE